ncbi:MAG TPA: choice-of-anchor L domain-containing protein, partial [Saprospiraceae bacterium]|nr:choice-of-anchor L domain-containing protein [Saprospiraceae bacterium]
FFLEQALIFGFGDYLTFYDGPNVNSPQIAQLGGSLFDEENTGGGGVCYTVRATSGCMTIQFSSDPFNEYQGWKGSWTCSSSPCDLPPALEIDQSVSAQDIENVLNTASNPVKVTKIDCPSGALGLFSLPAANSPLNMSKGLLLTSGNAFNAIGPNDQTDAETESFAPGDADLDYLSGPFGEESYDACVVELDVVATTDELTFEYVFGSEEYPEFTNDVYNDIFAFLISGPGIVGDPGLGGAKNIAVIPATTTPVEINSVNPIINWAYYRPNPINGPTLQYDGFAVDSFAKKKSLTARATVIPCNTYHLKLAIADRFDYQYDSGVFISEIKGGSPDVATAFDGDLPDLIESCTSPDQALVISIPDPLSIPIKYYVAVSGTARIAPGSPQRIP